MRIFNLISYQDVDFVYVWTYLYPLDLGLWRVFGGFLMSPKRLPLLSLLLDPLENAINHLREKYNQLILINIQSPVWGKIVIGN